MSDWFNGKPQCTDSIYVELQLLAGLNCLICHCTSVTRQYILFSHLAVLPLACVVQLACDTVAEAQLLSILTAQMPAPNVLEESIPCSVWCAATGNYGSQIERQ